MCEWVGAGCIIRAYVEPEFHCISFMCVLCIISKQAWNRCDLFCVNAWLYAAEFNRKRRSRQKREWGRNKLSGFQLNMSSVNSEMRTGARFHDRISLRIVFNCMFLNIYAAYVTRMIIETTSKMIAFIHTFILQRLYHVSIRCQLTNAQTRNG